MIVLGIDPGISGAVALYADGRLVEVCDMPVAGKEVDPYQLSKILEALSSPDATDMTVVETQQAMPEQGVSTTFKIGNNFGLVRGVVAALGYRITPVRPGVWKRRLDIPSPPSDVPKNRRSAWRKEKARLRASQLMPEGAGAWTLVKHDGRAEAALLAYYGANHGDAAKPSAKEAKALRSGLAGDLFADLEAA